MENIARTIWNKRKSWTSIIVFEVIYVLGLILKQYVSTVGDIFIIIAVIIMFISGI